MKDTLIATLKRLNTRWLSRSVAIVVLNSEKRYHVMMQLTSLITSSYLSLSNLYK